MIRILIVVTCIFPDFTIRQSETKIYSNVFTVGGLNWCIIVYPTGNNNREHLSIYLEYVGGSSPRGSPVKFSLTVVNQTHLDDSITHEDTHSGFSRFNTECGFKTFMKLTELHDTTKGYLVNNTLIVEAEVLVLIPSMVNSYFRNMDKFITDSPKPGLCLLNDNLEKSAVPNLEEVEVAKKCLKECLSDLFKLNIKDKLASSLQILSRAKTGLSSEEQQTIHLFCREFDDFVSDFLTFEHDNSEFELQKIKRDEIFLCLKKNHNTYNSNKKLINDLSREEIELMKRLEEVKSKRTQLESDSDGLIVAAVKSKAEYTIQLKKVEEAEEKKRIAEERMSRSTSAWSALKSHFV